jgi:hypothetical protein
LASTCRGPNGAPTKKTPRPLALVSRKELEHLCST